MGTHLKAENVVISTNINSVVSAVVQDTRKLDIFFSSSFAACQTFT